MAWLGVADVWLGVIHMLSVGLLDHTECAEQFMCRQEHCEGSCMGSHPRSNVVVDVDL
jgi:hypothetical protein